MDSLITAVDLTPGQFWLTLLVVFGAGVVRGFSGFALSAIIMAIAAVYLSPVELIPMMWWLEMTASLMMVRGGWKNADRSVVFGLVGGSVVGLPLGLWLTLSIPVDASRMVALSVIIVLAAIQLRRIRMKFLATAPGLYGTGLVAGVVTGLAGVGGMIVALYVLAQEAVARSMRGSLVLFLFLSSLASMVIHILFGTMTLLAITRGLIFAPAVVLGVAVGTMMFQPKYETYYKPFCLVLLIVLAAAGLVRLFL